MNKPALFAAVALCAGALTLTAPAAASARWQSPEPTVLNFGADGAADPVFRLSCAADGTRLAVFVPRLPRGTAADAPAFPTRLRLFFGRTETDLGGVATPLGNGSARVEALLPDPAAFFTALERQGRLVAVTHAGRTKAPAPSAEQAEPFRRACGAIR